MADQYNKKKQGPFIPRNESQKILTADEMGSKIQNMVVTEEGTLRGACGPAPYVPDYGSGYPSYSTMHGIFHAVMAQTGRDLLLLHTGDQLWVHQGWNIDVTDPDSTWQVLVGPSTANPELVGVLPNNEFSSFPTQFESTPIGVIVAPQGSRAFFYDGTTILPLGYDQAPAAPTGAGPQGNNCVIYAQFPTLTDKHGTYADDKSNYFVDNDVNKRGYAHDGSTSWIGGVENERTGMHPDYGFGSLGTLQVTPGVQPSTNTATLLPGTWIAKCQYVDKWGNLSPLSEESNPVVVEQERGDMATPWDLVTPHDNKITKSYYSGFRSGRLLKQFLWHSLPIGPNGTVGRNIVRTKDTINSGDLDFYEIVPDEVGSLTGFATLPDNVSTSYPDNIADGALGSEAVDARPVPEFRVCRVAFGRLWIANIPDSPGLVIPSLPGRWGTFEKNVEYEPDPTGAEITAMWRGFGGLFVFTQNSTFMITPSATVARNEQQGFQVETVNANVGCVGPSAIQTMQDGSLVWMGIDGFYRATMSRKEGLQIVPISDEIERSFRNLNKTRFRGVVSVLDNASGEYRCWVPDQNSKTNNLCLVYDGAGWRRRTDTQARAACVTNDHRRYTLVAGSALSTTTATGDSTITGTQAAVNGVWVTDHEVASFTPSTRDYVVETSWIAGLRSMDRKTAFTVYIWLRESGNSQLNVEVYRDWRMNVVHTETVNVHSTEDAPPFWGVASLGNAESYKLKRPFWVKADLFLPACEAFRLRLTSQTPYEFVGISVAEGTPDDSGMRIPK